MDLKKNDKLILIVGVFILIIAAIGVAIYTSPDTEDIKAGDTEPDYKIFTYSWKQNNGEITIEDSLFISKNTQYSDSFTVTTPTGSILTDVEVQINWADDETYGLLITKGEDTLIANIGQQGSESIEETSTGNGNMTFDFKVNDNPPLTDYIEAEDKMDAEMIIDDMYMGENTASFNFEVGLEIGERLLRPLKYLRDKGDEIELKTKYTYYYYEVEESDEDEEDDKTTGNDDGYNAYLGEFYKNLCYGKGMI